jgi:ParB-like chromosome segregation protein Spo0J
MIKVDSEFQALIPPLAAEERQQLESNILADGCRDPLVVWNDTLIDGHNRYEICTRLGIEFETVEIELNSRDDAKIWIIENQFGRRNLQPFTRTNLVLQLEPLIAAKAKENQIRKPESVPKKSAEQIETRQEVAKAANVSHDTVAKVKIINKAVEAGKVAPEVVSKLHSGEVSINRVVKDVKEAATAERRITQRKEAVSKAEPQSFDNVHVGDFRDHFDKVADGSLSLIFTDPPYDRKAEELFEGLADFASAKLAEGGSLVMYLGHLQLPAAFDAFNGKMRHWWTCACVHEGGKTLMREYGIRAGWKPMLWFVKGTRDDKQNIVSDVVSGTTEKSHHDWQQDQSEAEYWIENLCPSDGIVCDPFLGGGTTAAAAIKLSRKWIGFEINQDQAVLAMSRLKND